MHRLAGDAWEFTCHIVLRNGGDFHARALTRRNRGRPRHGSSSSKSFTVTLPKSPLVDPFDDVTAISDGLDGVYYQPRSQQFAAIDSVRQPNHLYQITNAEKRKEAPEAAALLQAVQQLRGDNVTLYYVVPRKHFHTFTAPHIDVRSLSAANVEKVQQIKEIVLAVEDDLETLHQQALAYSENMLAYNEDVSVDSEDTLANSDHVLTNIVDVQASSENEHQ